MDVNVDRPRPTVGTPRPSVYKLHESKQDENLPNGHLRLRHSISGPSNAQISDSISMESDALEETEEFISLTQTVSVAHKGTSLFVRVGILGTYTFLNKHLIILPVLIIRWLMKQSFQMLYII